TAVTAGTFLLLLLFTFLAWRRQPRFWTLGLTGGIGSGKSEALRWFESQGWKVLDLDAASRELVQRADVQSEIRTQLGPKVLDSSGAIDRAALRDAVFADATQRTKLEAILHPKLKDLYQEQARNARRGGYPGIICEGATIIEKNWHSHFDKILLLTSLEALRLERARHRTGLSEEQLRQILEAQASDGAKSAAADWVVENNGTVEELHRKLQELAPFGLKTRGH
ncbi:dephospho-CoA kinase, partial [bacterium]|nr:dephospho-CoA kinase [bacterium]